MPSDARNGETGPGGAMPRGFLTPCLLLLLRRWSAHGYRLMQGMMPFGFTALDPGTIYRTLRHLEKEGLVVSYWDTAAEGPARRVYSLTAAGEASLRTSAATLEQCHDTLEYFFRLYAGADAPDKEKEGGSP